jgi:hypothetical protein
MWMTALLWAGMSRADDLPEHVVRAGLAGDLSAVLVGLEDDPALDEDQRARLRARFLDRTERPEPTGRPLFDAVHAVYVDYWAAALTGTPGAEDALQAELSTLVSCATDDVLACVKGALLEEGVHVANGRTPPLLDLLAWTGEEERTWRVRLTDGVQPVTVVLMTDVVSPGWSSFATLGAASTGGWATDERLYCLADGYDLDSERFRVSYLAHEARHFADYAAFGELSSAELEYRAKLTELVYVRETLDTLLERFTAGADATGASPHGAANHRVLVDLEVELGQPPGRATEAEVRRASRHLLRSDTRAR